MSSKIKHNKKRNTAFLYEALVRELTKASIKKDSNKKEAIMSVIKECFKAGTCLYRELKIYQNIVNTKVDEKRLAEKILYESRIEHSAIDNKRLFNEQSNLISKINKQISQDVYTNFVPNYKDLATLHQIFNNPKIEAKSRVLLEETVVNKMILTEAVDTKMAHIDNIVYKTFVNNFNKQYENLSENQKTLLKNYLNSIDNDLEMKIYLDEEIGRLKTEISASEELEVFPEQKIKILNLLEDFAKKEVKEEELKTIMKIQHLLEESQKND